MTHNCFEVVDRTFKDILRFSNRKKSHIPFRVKVVVLGENCRQILPIILKGTKQYVVHASINFLYLWSLCKGLTLLKNMRLQSRISSEDVTQLKQFSNWVLSIENDTIDEINDENTTINIPFEIFSTTHTH